MLYVVCRARPYRVDQGQNEFFVQAIGYKRIKQRRGGGGVVEIYVYTHTHT